MNVYIDPTSFPDYVDNMSLEPKYSTHVNEIKEAVKTEAVVDRAMKYGTGAAVFWNGLGNKHIILPTFPITDNKVSTGKLDVSILRDVLEHKYLIAVILVTWGWYALGMFDGSKLVESKIGTGYIHKKHRKGGRSQKRFARRTEEQK
ncbi:MAG: hypothetical protein JSV54_05675, partial [Chloroflexota bacterium]